MSVHLEPASQLSFRRPLTQVTKELLLVTNPSNDPVMFKIKTTAPKQYCVRPNAGRVEPNSHVEVHVILQPFKEEPPADYKCKDKFLVQTAIIKPAYEALPIADMWSRVEQEDKAGIFQQKIKCAYLPPEEDPYLVNATSDQEPNQAVVPEPIVAKPIAPAPTAPVPSVPAPEQPSPPSYTSLPPTVKAETDGSSTKVVKEEKSSSLPDAVATPPPVVATPPSPVVVKDDVPVVVKEKEVSSPPINNTQLTHVDEVPEPKPRSVPSPPPAPIETIKSDEQPIKQTTSTTTSSPVSPKVTTSNKTTPPTTSQTPTNVTSTVAAAVAPTVAPTITAAAPAAATVAAPTPVQDDKEKKQLEEDLKKTKELVQQLQKQLATAQKEQEAKGGRNKLPSTVQPQDAVHQHLAALEKQQVPEGYPPQVVLIVAALTFVFTYLFF
ncbi:hypothetical protein INT45_003182 [Circinella minor]|uniref:MSP domain-containing protein n=1 Tax=Circinella minor TaxID=1195481 RepID=A0A8H7RTT2_9FUNG|nr:hypothetical protein INT45_003182 [Circinella minor]